MNKKRKENVLPTRGRLKINEMFYSLQGEGLHSGLPCSFIRLTGCPLRCVYCDTEYAFSGGNWFTIEDIEHFLEQQPSKLVQITGGEPLAQKGTKELIHVLCTKGYKVLLETSGAHPIKNLHPHCHIVMDLKTPGSGENIKNLWKNLDFLKKSDEIKFVVTDHDDWTWTQNEIKKRDLDSQFNILISPDSRSPQMLPIIADQVLKSGLNLRLQTQLHKIIWGGEPGR